MTKLLGYNFELRYKPEAVNKVVDALSRQPTLIEAADLGAIVCDNVIQWKERLREIENDNFLARVRKREDLVQVSLWKMDGYCIKGG